MAGRYEGTVVARGCGPGRACFRVTFECDGTAEHVRPGAHRYRVLQPSAGMRGGAGRAPAAAVAEPQKVKSTGLTQICKLSQQFD